jgi:hypothetical protein
MPELHGLVPRPTPFPPELLERPVLANRLGCRSLWLYLLLRSVATPNAGTVDVTREDLSSLAGAKPETISSLLGRLRKNGYVSFGQSRDRWRIRVTHWPHSQPARAVADDGPELDAGLSFAREIAAALGDFAHLDLYEEIVESHPRAVVERALRDASAMPESRIRKSRGALFTHLVRQYAESEDDAT